MIFNIRMCENIIHLKEKKNEIEKWRKKIKEIFRIN